MALRWSKTINAYHKYAYIFHKQLPAVIPIDEGKNAITIAGYIRDVIKFAYEHNLAGAEWFGKVVVSPDDTDRVTIKAKSSNTLAQTTNLEQYPSKSLFEVIALYQENKLRPGYRFYALDSPQEIEETLDSLGVKYVMVNNLIKIAEETDEV